MIDSKKSTAPSENTSQKAVQLSLDNPSDSVIDKAAYLTNTMIKSAGNVEILNNALCSLNSQLSLFHGIENGSDSPILSLAVDLTKSIGTAMEWLIQREKSGVIDNQGQNGHELNVVTVNEGPNVPGNTESSIMMERSKEIEITRLLNNENEKISFWDIVLYCRTKVIPQLRASNPNIKNCHLKWKAVKQGLVPATKSGNLREPWNWAMEINYELPSDLFDLVSKTIFARDRLQGRKQTLFRVSISYLATSWALNEQIVKDILNEMKNILQRKLKFHFEQLQNSGVRSEEYANKITKHIEFISRFNYEKNTRRLRTKNTVSDDPEDQTDPLLRIPPTDTTEA